MTTVTGLTADRMLAIEAASVVDGDVDGSGNLILIKHDGSQINAGSVIGPPGPQGPIGNMLSVLSAAGILDVGVVNQIRAGRQLSPADFANIGLNAPAGLWNLSDPSDSSGNGRNLNPKGPITYVPGINGIVSTSAFFSGAGGQAFYIADTGVADPFRIKTGSVGCWFRTTKRAVIQMLVDKYGTANQQIFSLFIGSANLIGFNVCPDGSNNAFITLSQSDVCDDRWHFAVGTADGALARLYIDGVLEGSVAAPFAMFSGSSALNIGCRGVDAANNGTFQHLGRIDEAFVTADVLSDDQVRNLYCAKIAHTLAIIPARIALNVRRRKKGAAFVPSDFSTQPLRLHNFSAGSLGDQGSNNQTLTNAAVPPAVSVAGVDGSAGNAFSFAGSQALTATSTGLPSGLTPRSYGCWFKSTSLAAATIIGWGSAPLGTTDCRFGVSNGQVFFTNSSDAPSAGAFVSDGQWHFAVIAEDNAATDGSKRRLYIDGKIALISTVMNAVTPGGANTFRIAAAPDGTQAFVGQVDSAFVCDYALTADQIHALYAKGSQALSPSPKNVGDHVEGMDAANLYAIFDTLDSQHQIDLAVA